MEEKNQSIVHINNNNNNNNKKLNKGKTSLISIAMLVIMISSGMILFCEKFVFAQTSKISVDTLYNKSKEIESKNVDNKNSGKVLVRQYGAFSSEKNAKDFIDTNKLNGKYIINENDLYKIMGEIYLDYNYDLILDKYKGVDTTKTEINFNKDSIAERYSWEIINGVLQILNKFTTAEVEFVETKNLKTWTNDLVKNEQVKDDNKYEDFEKLKKYVSDLPEKIKCENLDSLYETLYNLITNFR